MGSPRHEAGKATRYMHEAFKTVSSKGLHLTDQETAVIRLTRHGWATAGIVVERMSPEEWDIWNENSELPPWVGETLRI